MVVFTNRPSPRRNRYNLVAARCLRSTRPVSRVYLMGTRPVTWHLPVGVLHDLFAVFARFTGEECARTRPQTIPLSIHRAIMEAIEPAAVNGQLPASRHPERQERPAARALVDTPLPTEDCVLNDEPLWGAIHFDDEFPAFIKEVPPEQPLRLSQFLKKRQALWGRALSLRCYAGKQLLTEIYFTAPSVPSLAPPEAHRKELEYLQMDIDVLRERLDKERQTHRAELEIVRQTHRAELEIVRQTHRAEREKERQTHRVGQYHDSVRLDALETQVKTLTATAEGFATSRGRNPGETPQAARNPGRSSVVRRRARVGHPQAQKSKDTYLLMALALVTVLASPPGQRLLSWVMDWLGKLWGHASAGTGATPARSGEASDRSLAGSEAQTGSSTTGTVAVTSPR